MKYTTTVSLVLAIALGLAGAGMVAAQDDDFQAEVDDFVAEAEQFDTDDTATTTTTSSEFEDNGWGEWRSCSADNVGEGLVSVADLDETNAQEREYDQTVGVDEDTILLGIALANNGANGVNWAALRDYDATLTETMSASRSANLDREDVFSALALGVSAEGGALDALACVSDVEQEQTRTHSVSRSVDLDEDTVLLSIALANSVGGNIEFNDVASFSESSSMESERSSTVDVEREDAFLALALGAGGSD